MNRFFKKHEISSRVLKSLFVLLLFLASTLGIILLTSPPVKADEDYDFKLEKEHVDVFIRKDGGIDIHYTFQFVNYGKLDGVDVGLPNRFYSKSSARAWIEVDGQTYSPKQIRKSPYVYIGLAVEFKDSTRKKIENVGGKRLTVGFQVKNPHMVYKNELKKGTVGIKFRPTWFDPDYQRGNTGELKCRIFFPEGFTNESEAVYLKHHQWDSLYMDSETGRLVASWNRTNVDPRDQEDGDYDIGAGFPRQYVDKYYEHDFWEKLGDVWYATKWYAVKLAPCWIATLVITLFVGMNIHSRRKMAKDYFEPKMSVAGAGPRRDLTAVEAAVALERPLDVVATMILFGLMKKGKLEIVSYEKPMKLMKMSHEADYAYEIDYLNSIKIRGVTCALEDPGTIDRVGLRVTLVGLVKSVQKKLEGFDFKATKRYYEKICEEAWRQVKEARTPEEFAADFSDCSAWMLLDENYEDRIEDDYSFHPWYSSYHYPPHYHHYFWYHRYHHSSGLGGTGRTLQQMLSNYTSTIKSANSNLISSMKSLGGEVTRLTHPAAFSSGSGGGGGGGCACACACACAGGGR